MFVDEELNAERLSSNLLPYLIEGPQLDFFITIPSSRN
jgi:hypothetical protein